MPRRCEKCSTGFSLFPKSRDAKNACAGRKGRRNGITQKPETTCSLLQIHNRGITSLISVHLLAFSAFGAKIKRKFMRFDFIDYCRVARPNLSPSTDARRPPGGESGRKRKKHRKKNVPATRAWQTVRLGRIRELAKTKVRRT